MRRRTSGSSTPCSRARSSTWTQSDAMRWLGIRQRVPRPKVLLKWSGAAPSTYCVGTVRPRRGGPRNMTQAPDLPADIVSPDPETAASSRIPDWDAVAGPAADFRTFWEDRAKELEWYEPWHTVLDDSDAPFYKWFTGGKVNIVHNLSLIHISEPTRLGMISYAV